MSSTHPNIYATSASALQTVSNLTEEAKVYYEAVEIVLSKPEYNEIGAEARAFVLTHRTLEDLQQELEKTRNGSQMLSPKQKSRVWRSSKGLVNSLVRFEKAITCIAATSPCPFLPLTLD